jgi:hypothetical protein
MSKTIWIRNVIASSLAGAVFITSSMVSLAAPGNQPQMAELTVSGASIDGEAPAVSINGERAFSGRSVQSSTTVTTPATSSATINLGKLGRIELAPNSSLNLNFNENGFSGNLLAGRVRVAGATNAEASIQTSDSTVVADKTQSKAFAVDFDANATRVATESGSVMLNGKTKSVKVNAGETKTTSQDNDDNDGDIVPGSVVLYSIIFGAAAAVLIYVAATSNNEVSVGGSTTVVSPTR